MPAVYCENIKNVEWKNEFNEELNFCSVIDVWKIPVFTDNALLDFLHENLCKDEIEKLLRFHQQKDRQRFITSHGVLRFLLGKYLKLSPDKIQFVTDQNKKPLLNANDDLHFNIAHSGDWILIAISDSAIGIDLEKIDKDFSYYEILSLNFSKEEIEFINNSDQPKNNFYLLWTRKEALMKATAKGIDDKLIFISTLDGLHEIDDQIIGSKNAWNINSFQINENYVGSISFNPLIKRINFREFSSSFFLHPV
jgi:4'-phosphopantetheinyl transferase